MVKSEYYDGTKLLSLNDINGEKPEIYMCTTNRTGGKTTYFSRLCVNKFLENKGKFALLYRYNYELDECADKFFKDIRGLFFNGMEMTAKKRAKGIFYELYLDGKSCGYAMALNNADAIKKYSHFFSDVERILFDEFQSETNHYCSDEVTKFLSIHTSIARGKGKQVRYVPVYMISNTVSLINPYYIAMGISTRLQSATKFLRGDGFVLEQGFVETASRAQKESGVNRAFASCDYVAYASECIYLNDNQAFIAKPEKNNGRYICTLRYKNVDYAIREYKDLGILYCDDRADKTFPMRISVTTDDHNINYVMLKTNDMFISTLRWYFEHGCFRFKDLRCKEAILKCISY